MLFKHFLAPLVTANLFLLSCKSAINSSATKEVVDHGNSGTIAGIGYPVVTTTAGLGLASHFANNCILLVRTEDVNFDELRIFSSNCAGVRAGESPIASALVDKIVWGSDMRKIYVKSKINDKYYRTGHLVCALGKPKAGGSDDTNNKFGDSISCNLEMFASDSKAKTLESRMMLSEFCLALPYRQGVPFEENHNCRIEKANDSVTSVEFTSEGTFDRNSIPSAFLPKCADDNSPMACSKFIKIPAGPFTMGTNEKLKYPGKFVNPAPSAGGPVVFSPDWRYRYNSFIKTIAPQRTYIIDYDYEMMDAPLTQGNVLSIVGAHNYWAIRNKVTPSIVEDFDKYFDKCTPDFTADSAKVSDLTLNICSKEPYLFKKEIKSPDTIKILITYLNKLDEKYEYGIATEPEWEKAMRCGESGNFPSEWTDVIAECSPDNLNNQKKAIPFINLNRSNKCGIKGVLSYLEEIVRGSFEPDFLTKNPEGTVNPSPTDMTGFTSKSVVTSFDGLQYGITNPCVIGSFWGRAPGGGGLANKIRLIRRLR
jgi:formylglycine-generating enzyme required for sulfatase activity